MKITETQGRFILDHIGQGLIFVGEIRGKQERSNTFPERRDNKGKVIAPETTVRERALKVEIDIDGELPREIRVVQGVDRKTDEFPVLMADKGDMVIVVVGTMKIDDFTKDTVVRAKQVTPLPGKDAKTYELKGAPPVVEPLIPAGANVPSKDAAKVAAAKP